MEVLVVSEGGTLHDLEGVDDREAAVKLATGDVVVEVLHRRVSLRRPHSRDPHRHHPVPVRLFSGVTAPTFLYHSIASAGMPSPLR